MNIPNPKCQKCAHRQGNNCALSNTPLTNLDTFCPHYTESAYICELCGKHLFKEAVNYTYGDKQSYHLICLNCYSLLFTCQTCQSANTCAFEQDQTVSEPPYVMAQMRQGNSIIQQQIKNPKRIELTCKVNCPCFINDECQRQNGGSCDKYRTIVNDW